MVDESSKTDEKEKAKENIKKEAQEAPQVCSLSIPTIIAALHQTALAHSNAASKNATIANSALEGDGKDAKLASAGEHIISVIPNEGGVLQKVDAIVLLSEYVQWFVGPDLAKKVNDSTVKSLTEAPGSEKNESKKFMSFSKFLMLEAEEDDLAAADEQFSSEENREEEKSTESEKKEEDKKPEEEDKKDGKPEEKDGNKEGEVDETKESKTGYYIAYNLKVEGLPQTALKDAMKKFAKTLFDGVKITASGLFGGGDSFTVKDIKDAVNDIFGPIDPNDLVDKVEKEISTKYPKHKPDEVMIRDKTTLISDLGKNIDAAQKQKISTADYSLWIKINEYEATKPIFNQRIIADIVQSSITGIFKKFKNKVTKNDVIFIEDYVDTNDNTKSTKQLNISVPEPENFTKKMHNPKATIQSVWADIDNLIDPIFKNKQKKNSTLADECSKVWKDFKEKHGGDKELNKTKSTREEIIEYFKDFIEAYTKVFNKYKDQQSLNESLRVLRSLINNRDFKHFIFESMYGNAFLTNVPSNSTKRDAMRHDIMSILLEEEPSEGEDSKKNKEKEEDALSDEDIKNISSAFKNKLVDIIKDTTTLAIKPFAIFGKSEDVSAWLEERGIASNDVKAKLSEFPYAAAHVLKLPKKFNDAGEIDEENGTLGKASTGYKVYTSDNVKSALESAVDEKIDEPVIEYEATSNGKLKYNKTKIPATCKVRVLLLDIAKQNGEEPNLTSPNPDDSKPDTSEGGSSGGEPNPNPDDPKPDTSEGGSSGGEGSGKTKRTDVYIIPLPGLKYKDKEH